MPELSKRQQMDREAERARNENRIRGAIRRQQKRDRAIQTRGEAMLDRIASDDFRDYDHESEFGELTDLADMED